MAGEVVHTDDPRFDPVWQVIKRWEIQRLPRTGYAGATGTDVQVILDALDAAPPVGAALPGFNIDRVEPRCGECHQVRRYDGYWLQCPDRCVGQGSIHYGSIPGWKIRLRLAWARLGLGES